MRPLSGVAVTFKLLTDLSSGVRVVYKGQAVFQTETSGISSPLKLLLAGLLPLSSQAEQ